MTTPLGHNNCLAGARIAARLGRYEAAFERARKTVHGMHADWTHDPPSQEDDGLWRYSSQNTRVALAFLAMRLTEVEAERDRWRLEATGVAAFEEPQ
jgi:hypothetical protein